PYLREDLPHVPVAFEPGGTTIGPLIIPGRTACLACRDAHERDRDPAWPAMHAQLVAATSVPITGARTAEAAVLVARILIESGNAKRTKSVRISPDGRRVWHAVTFHAECRCREQSFQSPERTAIAAAPGDRPHETRKDQAFAQRA